MKNKFYRELIDSDDFSDWPCSTKDPDIPMKSIERMTDKISPDWYFNSYELGFFYEALSPRVDRNQLCRASLMALSNRKEKLASVAAFNSFSEVRFLIQQWLESAGISEFEDNSIGISSSIENFRTGTCPNLDANMLTDIFGRRDLTFKGKARQGKGTKSIGRGLFLQKQGQTFGFVKSLGNKSMLSLKTIRDGESFPLIAGSAYAFSAHVRYALARRVNRHRNEDAFPVIDIEEIIAEARQSDFSVRPLKTLWPKAESEKLKLRLRALEVTRQHLDKGRPIPRARLIETLGLEI